MKNVLKNKIWFVLVLFVTALICIFCFLRFDTVTENAEAEYMQSMLQMTAHHISADLSASYASRLAALEAMGHFCADKGSLTSDTIEDVLVFLARTGNFKYTGVIDLNGHLLDSNGRHANVSNQDYFKAALDGDVGISGSIRATDSSEDLYQILSAPILSRSGSIKGIVIGVCAMEDAIAGIENTLSNHAYFHLADEDGTYLVRSHHLDSVLTGETIWDDLELCALTVGSVKQIRYNFSNHFSGFFRYEIGDRQRSVYYTPLEITGGYLFASVNDRYSQSSTSNMQHHITSILIEVFVCFLLLLLGIFIYNQVILYKNKRSLKRIESRRALMQTAIEHSNQILFEYDIERRASVIRISREFARNEGEEFINLPEIMIKHQMVSPNSQDDLKRLFNEIEINDYCEADLLLKNGTRFCWFNLLLQNVYDKHGILINTVGVATNIDDQKRREIDLAEQADTDALTGLFNASALKRKMAQMLKADKPEEMQSFFVILDLDNFKKINDTFGHAYGDRVLMDVADTIRRNISTRGFACRLGGDEFAFVLRGYNEEEAHTALSTIVHQLHRIYESGGTEITVSASAGAVEAHVYGTTFDELYKKSDKMLYNIKRTTKNDYLFYPGPQA